MILRQAEQTELDAIWEIIRYAIQRRKEAGSDQWQQGYPNRSTIQEDLDKRYAYVLEENDRLLLYAAVVFDKEPAYENINGQWLSDGDYAVLHRIAVSPAFTGKGMGFRFFQMVEKLCIEKDVYSIKVDTNFDNIPMLKLLEKLGYHYCGEVLFEGAPRKAFEKMLGKSKSDARLL